MVMHNTVRSPLRQRANLPARPSGKRGLLPGIRVRVLESVEFFGAFLRRPAAVGAVAPSSRALALAMIQGMNLKKADTVVELGPGTGAFTRPIREGIGDRTVFFSLELDSAVAEGLQKRFPELIVYNDSAERIPHYLTRHGKRHADYIISGLPWATLPIAAQDRIWTAVVKSLSPSGAFATFAYVHALWLPSAVRFRRRLQRSFAQVEISPIIWHNVPPAFVYHCTRFRSETPNPFPTS